MSTKPSDIPLTRQDLLCNTSLFGDMHVKYLICPHTFISKVTEPDFYTSFLFPLSKKLKTCYDTFCKKKCIDKLNITTATEVP